MCLENILAALTANGIINFVKMFTVLLQRLGQTWSHPEYIMCLENILAALTALQRYEEADQNAMKVCKFSCLHILFCHSTHILSGISDSLISRK